MAHSGRRRWAGIGRGLFPALLSIMALIAAHSEVAAQSPNGAAPQVGVPDPTLPSPAQGKAPGAELLTLTPVRPQDADAIIRSRRVDPNLIGSSSINGDLHLVAPANPSPTSGQ